jgi:hypothetical protein
MHADRDRHGEEKITWLDKPVQIAADSDHSRGWLRRRDEAAGLASAGARTTEGGGVMRVVVPYTERHPTRRARGR